MKNLPRLLALATLASAAFYGCDKKPAASPDANPESARTFESAGKYLDAGGDFYFYVRTEQLLAKLPAKLDEMKAAIVEMAGPEISAPPEQIDAWYAAGKKALLDTGITQLRAFGMSGIQLEPGLSRTKSVAYTGGMENPGLIWKLGGQRQPHAFDMLEILPADAVYTLSLDLDATALYSYLTRIIDSLPDAAVKAQALQLPATAEAALGMPPQEFFAALGSEAGFVITADEKETMAIPYGGKPKQLPKMAAALIFRVADDRLYDLLVKQIEGSIGQMMPLQKADADGVRSVTVQFPQSGLPIAPTVARFGDYTVVSTSDGLVAKLARKGANPPPLLKDTEAFQRFAKLEKMEGNSFALVTERGTQILRRFQMLSFEDNPGVTPAATKNLEKIYDLFSQKFIFSIGRQEKDASASVMYSPNGSEQVIATFALVPVAIVGAIAVPAVQKAMERAREVRQTIDEQDASPDAAPPPPVSRGE